jgi:hypothetical protein
MHATFAMTAAVCWGLSMTVPAVAGPARPQPPGHGTVAQPYGYEVWANKPGASGHGNGKGGANGPGSDADPGCVLMPGPYPTMQVCGGNGASNWFTLPVSPGDPAPTVTPAQLALSAYQRLVIPQPSIGTAPPRGKEGLVGLRHFFWAEGAQWQPLRTSAQAGSVWAEVTAVPTKLVIHPGDGSSVVCAGHGTPYDPSRSPDDQDTGCTHLYERSSARRPASAYQVTANAIWTATWTGSGGSGGVLPSITRSSSFPLRIAEGQALTQRSS